MSRSGFCEDGDYDPLAEGRWTAARNRAFSGKRGQAFLRDLLASLEAMPEKRLIANDLKREDGSVCAIGAVGVSRGVDMSGIDPEDYKRVSSAFDISEIMVREIVFINDDDFEWHGIWKDVYWVNRSRYDGHDRVYEPETPESRYNRILAWVKSMIVEDEKPLLASQPPRRRA